MIELTYKRGFLRIKELWFMEANVDNQSRKGCDLVLCRQAGSGIEKGTQLPFTTLITELDSPEEELFKKLSKTYRYQIRKSQKEGLNCEIYDSAYLKKDKTVVQQFISFFNDFAGTKRLAHCNTKKLYRLLDGSNLIISVCRDDKVIYAYHAYLHDNIRARLWYSASSFRKSEDQQFRSLAARGNKLLHWNDLMQFKNWGYKIYDWGGYAAENVSNELLGINQFKADFGGVLEKGFNYSVPNTLTGKTFKVLYEKLTGRVCY